MIFLSLYELVIKLHSLKLLLTLWFLNKKNQHDYILLSFTKIPFAHTLQLAQLSPTVLNSHWHCWFKAVLYNVFAADLTHTEENELSQFEYATSWIQALWVFNQYWGILFLMQFEVPSFLSELIGRPCKSFTLGNETSSLTSCLGRMIVMVGLSGGKN